MMSAQACRGGGGDFVSGARLAARTSPTKSLGGAPLRRAPGERPEDSLDSLLTVPVLRAGYAQAHTEEMGGSFSGGFPT